jgi:hypothetical protein
MRAALGIAIVAAHALGFLALAAHSRGRELAVELAAPRSIEGAPSGNHVEVHDEGAAPGLVHRRWASHYRGGFERAVGTSALAGPFQDPATPPCSGRVVVGQRLLDELAAGMAKLVDRELRGESIFPVGGYQRLDGMALRWAGPDSEAPHGSVRATATVVFERARVPLVVSLVPQRAGDKLTFEIAAHAELRFGNGAIDWVGQKLGANQLASRLARRQIDDVLVTTFAAPPPFQLPGGQTLAFGFCDAPVEIRDDAYGALPFGVKLGGLATAAPEVRPPRMPSGVAPSPGPGTRLALDLDLNALNALLFELWRTGWLDRKLDEVGLDRTFAEDPTVASYLSIRISPLSLALPPVISAGPGGSLRLAADARTTIRDGDAATTGRVFGALDFTFAPPTRAVAVDLGALELSCERSPTTLVPCYGDLVAAMRERGDRFHGALTTAFSGLLAQVFVDRELSAPGLPGALAIDGAVPSLTGSSPVLHLELDARLRGP